LVFVSGANQVIIDYNNYKANPILICNKSKKTLMIGSGCVLPTDLIAQDQNSEWGVIEPQFRLQFYTEATGLNLTHQ
jgi:hypothetical protein